MTGCRLRSTKPTLFKEHRAVRVRRPMVWTARASNEAVLREGEQPVGTFVERLGLEQANLSQHLAILRAKQLVTTRKAGNQVFYSVRDSLIWKILDLMLRYFQKQVGESMSMLEEMERTEGRK